MLPALRVWHAVLVLTTGIGLAVARPSPADLAAFARAEEDLGKAFRESGRDASRWVWLEGLARLAWGHAETGKHATAARHYRRALDNLPGDAEASEPEFVALLHDGLGRALHIDGEFAEAEEHLRVGLRIRAAQQGEDADMQRGKSEGHLGLLCLVRGRYDEAERLFHSALDRTPSDAHNLLAHRHDCLGRYFLAIRAHRLAAGHFETALAHATRDVAEADALVLDLQTNLALCRFRAGEPRAALALVDSMLKRDPANVDDRLRRAGSLNLSGTIRTSLGEHEQARQDLKKALGIVEKHRGRDHPAVAPILANLGAVRLAAGDAPGALQMLMRAKSLLERNVAAHHQTLVEILYQIAACRLDAGPRPEARQAVDVARKAAGDLMNELVATGSERELLTFRSKVDLHSIVCRLGDAETIANSLLEGKGRIREAILERRTRSRDVARSAVALQQELDRLLLDRSPATHDRIAHLRRRIRELGASRAAPPPPPAPPRWQDVSSALVPGTAFVDCVRYYPSSNSAPRYGAVILLGEGEPRWIPLGEEKRMSRLELLHRSLEIRADILRRGEGSPGIPMAPLLTDLYRAFWQPIDEALPDDVREVIVCPEGELHLLPFAALRSPDGRFLAERLRVLRIVESGRSFVQESVEPVAISSPWMLLGVSDFAPHRTQIAAGRSRLLPRWTEALKNVGDLPTVPKEVSALKALAPPRSRVLRNAAANEGALQTLDFTPSMLHLASHGLHVPLAGVRDLAADPSALYENGILLGLHADGDGVLFPEEAGALDLRGTLLVTISTCRSALGRPVSGEGLLGLRRGFAKAGARNVLASLWEIPDRSTAAFMTAYYRKLVAHPDPAAVLWSMQADRLRKLHGQDPTGANAETAILSSAGFVVISQAVVSPE